MNGKGEFGVFVFLPKELIYEVLQWMDANTLITVESVSKGKTYNNFVVNNSAKGFCELLRKDSDDFWKKKLVLSPSWNTSDFRYLYLIKTVKKSASNSSNYY